MTDKNARLDHGIQRSRRAEMLARELYAPVEQLEAEQDESHAHCHGLTDDPLAARVARLEAALRQIAYAATPTRRRLSREQLRSIARVALDGREAQPEK
jgi:hypothetical protein